MKDVSKIIIIIFIIIFIIIIIRTTYYIFCRRDKDWDNTSLLLC